MLCAIDFSPASLAALGHALSIARADAARLTLLHVLEALSEEEVRVHARARVGEHVAACRRDARQRLDSLLPPAERTSGRVSSVVELGRPAPAIVHAAGARQADLIVMGAHGAGGSDLASFGSATQGVLRHATCPVLTTTAADGQPSIPSLSTAAQAPV